MGGIVEGNEAILGHFGGCVAAHLLCGRTEEDEDPQNINLIINLQLHFHRYGWYTYQLIN